MATQRRTFIDRYGLYLLLVVAVVLRALYLIHYSSLPDWQQLTVDANYHHHWAQDIAEGDVFGDTTYFRAPFYVFCLGLLYALLGDGLWIGRLFGAAIGAASAGMTYVLGRRLFDARVGMVAGLLHGVYPLAIYFEPELLVDPLYTLLLLVALHRFVIWYESGRSRDALLFAITLGLASITRPNALVLLPVALLVLVVRRKEMPGMVRQFAAVVVGLGLVIGPTTARNVLVADDPTLIATSGGINLYIGNNPEADGVSAVLPAPLGPTWRLEQLVTVAEREAGKSLKPGEVSSYWTGEAVAWIGEDPGGAVMLFARKLALFFSNALVSNNRELSQFFDRVPMLGYNPLRFAVLLPLALIALIVGAWENRPLRWILLFVLLSILSGALFFYATRFRLPLLPVFFVLAGYGAVALAGLWRENRSALMRLSIAGIVVGVVTLVIPVPTSENVSTHALIEAGGYEYGQGNYVAAWRNYQSAALLDSTYPGIHANLGAVLLQLEQTDSALASYERELRQHPWYTPALTNLAHAHLVRKDLEEAMRAARGAIAKEPWDPGANVILLRALAEVDTLTVAQFRMEAAAAAERTGNDVYLLVMIGDLLLNRGEAAVAKTYFTAALKSEGPAIEMDHEAFRHEYRNSRENRNRQKAAAANQLAYLAGTGNRIAEAIDFSRRAIEYAPEQIEAYLNLYSGYMSGGQRVRADSLLGEMARLFPDNRYVRELMQRR